MSIPNDTRPLSERVYERISSDIIDGKIPAGSALVQEQVAAQYGVSRTPVRDALTKLTHDSLATLVQGKGYIVNDLTDRQVEDVYEVRHALETLAARQSCGHHTSAQLVRLRALIDESEILDPQDATELFRLSRSFHAGLVEPCPNRYLLGILNSIWDDPIQRRITMTYEQGAEHQSKVVADHRRILEAIKNNDADTVAEVLKYCHNPADRRNRTRSNPPTGKPGAGQPGTGQPDIGSNGRTAPL